MFSAQKKIPVPASQKVRTISRRYRDGWALRCRCAHVVPPRGAALAARGPGGIGGCGPAGGSGVRAERPKRRGEAQPPLFSECSDRRVQNAARLLLVRGPPFRDPRSSSRPEGPNALDFVKRIGLVRPEMALDRAPRGLTRRCRRRFHFFVAPRSALRAFIFSAHRAPACSFVV